MRCGWRLRKISSKWILCKGLFVKMLFPRPIMNLQAQFCKFLLLLDIFMILWEKHLWLIYFTLCEFYLTPGDVDNYCFWDGKLHVVISWKSYVEPVEQVFLSVSKMGKKRLLQPLTCSGGFIKLSSGWQANGCIGSVGWRATSTTAGFYKII